MTRSLFKFFSSLKLTIVLLAASIILVFFGTLAQVHYGVYHTQQLYFESFIAIWEYPRQWIWGDRLDWLFLPMPGGYILGPLLVVNLVCAHFRYFRARWSKAGIVLIHFGVVLLLVGQLATQVAQKDYFMWIDEGGSANYLESFTEDELVLINKSAGEQWREVRIPVDRFKSGSDGHPVSIQHHALPFRVEVLGFLPNAGMARRQDLPSDAPRMVFNRGIGAEIDLVVWQEPMTFAQNMRNNTTAIVRLASPAGEIGTWLVSNSFRSRRPDGVMTDMFSPQEFEINGQRWEIAMRYAREYLPTSLELREFTHERYPGTEIPRNFASRVYIGGDQHRETVIYMNNPLRFAGYTFYQASFANQDTSSMFQVVSNPARWFPYVASGIISLGLMVQFVLGLTKFAGRQRRSSSASSQDKSPLAQRSTEAVAR